MSKEYYGNDKVSNLVLGKASKEQLRQIIQDYGAHVCGFAGRERFQNLRKESNPCTLFEETKSIISFGISLPKGVYRIEDAAIYEHYNKKLVDKVEEVTYKIAMLVEQEYGGIAVPLISTGNLQLLAVQAGLGTIEQNTYFLNSKYGERLILGAVLTNMEIESDSYTRSICMPDCKQCMSQGNEEKNAKELKPIEQVCPVRFGEL
ncbi:hypothetical protein [Anaerosporobacter faecicola]|uniref:hypothetical protein n=1 Tax=Anaerosporobacter faecicola TaxID=2718714 RepID=UPI00143B06B4|nr:hypothetical protein [Anaerosporobacter faecicola]